MLEQFKVYIISTILAIIASLSIALYIQTVRLDNSNTKLAIIDNESSQQEQKAKEVIKVVKEIKWKTKEKIRYVYSYKYDENKTDCRNAISLLRNGF